MHSLGDCAYPRLSSTELSNRGKEPGIAADVHDAKFAELLGCSAYANRFECDRAGVQLGRENEALDPIEATQAQSVDRRDYLTPQVRAIEPGRGASGPGQDFDVPEAKGRNVVSQPKI